MNIWQLKHIIILLLILIPVDIFSQGIAYKGMAVGWGTIGKSDDWALQFGGRYIPQADLLLPLNDKLTIEGEFSANLVGSYSNNIGGEDWYGKIKPYRMWMKISGNQFEVRAGLQKINFGSATILRPLMWFDRIDPRDPLQLTDGVYGLLGRYYTLNNINFWGWALYGNNETKGWESYKTEDKNIEFGGRVQFPIPRAEIGLSYHNRKAKYIEYLGTLTGTIPETKYGFDIKADLGVGIWIENVLVDYKKEIFMWQRRYNNFFTAGSDYTFGIGNGVNVMAEHLIYSMSSNLSNAFANENSTHLSGITINYPISLTMNVSYLSFFDWSNKKYYKYINAGLTFDKFSYYLILFSNPSQSTLFTPNSSSSIYGGTGFQVMIVFNH